MRAAGGLTMAQDEASADCFDMPGAAIDLGRADIVFSPRKIAEALQVLADGLALPPPFWNDEPDATLRPVMS